MERDEHLTRIDGKFFSILVRGEVGDEAMSLVTEMLAEMDGLAEDRRTSPTLGALAEAWGTTVKVMAALATNPLETVISVEWKLTREGGGDLRLLSRIRTEGARYDSADDESTYGGGRGR